MFLHVCSRGGLCPGSSPPCCTVMCGRYASYWNAFLSIINLHCVRASCEVFAFLQILAISKHIRIFKRIYHNSKLVSGKSTELDEHISSWKSVPKESRSYITGYQCGAYRIQLSAEGNCSFKPILLKAENEDNFWYQDWIWAKSKRAIFCLDLIL